VLNTSSATDELNDQHYQSQYQQDVDVGSDGVKAYETYQPQHQKNYKNRPKHISFSSYVSAYVSAAMSTV
jgi:hypothetical protein